MQDLNAVVVQIRARDDHRIVGTGFIVNGIDGLIATCWHVVQEARVVMIGFPGETSLYTAEIAANREADDVAILRLEQPLPYGWTSAILGPSKAVEGHSFRTKGYAHLGSYTGLKAEGRILGSMEVEAMLPPCYPPLQISSQGIDEGMSGAPILDIHTDRVVGMVSQIWTPTVGSRQRDAASAVSTEALIACWPSLKLQQTIERLPVSLATVTEDISRLLQLSDYRVIEQTAAETMLLFVCQRIEEGNITPVLVAVVEDEATAADLERMKQLLMSAQLDQGLIIGVLVT